MQNKQRQMVILWGLGVCLLAVSVGLAQWTRDWRRGRRAPDRSEYPVWEYEPAFQHDVFTFVRVRYGSSTYGRGRRWDNDFPDSDWNFSYRLQELTSLKVDPNGRVIELTDPELFDYPFIYMNGVGQLEFTDEEVTNLRRYLLRGGFMMVDDFWGVQEWHNFSGQMQRVFPDRNPQEIPLEHPLFHLVYDMQEKPQVPDIRTWRSGSTFEYRHGDSGGDESPHYRAYLDDQDRIMALLCHNNDLGDGWEREGEEPEYFRQYSERFSYPMGINIITYVMTH